MAAASAGLAVGAVPLAASTPRRKTPSTPDEAIERLMAGNERFVSGAPTELRRGMDRVRELSGGQSPYAAILGCADSRVPVEILFDEGFGDLFTVRVAGNVATPEEIASLEYAVGVLGSQVIPAVPAGASIDEAVEANARYQAKVLSSASPVIREAIAAGTVKVQPAVYGLEDGRVRAL